MNKRKLVEILKIIFFSSIPAVLALIANSNKLFELLLSKELIGNKLNIELIKEICLIGSVFFSSIIIPIKICCLTENFENANKKSEQLLGMTKQFLKSVLKEFESSFKEFNVRIFVLKNPLKYKIFELLHIKKYRKKFKIKNQEGLSVAGITKKLEFEVIPKKQGLVGECYHTHKLVIDTNLQENNGKIYGLDYSQIQKTLNLKWIICAPIHENNEVIAVMSFDGEEEIKIDDKNKEKIEERIEAYVAMLFDAAPNLFKKG